MSKRAPLSFNTDSVTPVPTTRLPANVRTEKRANAQTRKRDDDHTRQRASKKRKSGAAISRRSRPAGGSQTVQIARCSDGQDCAGPANRSNQRSVCQTWSEQDCGLGRTARRSREIEARQRGLILLELVPFNEG